jgi:hypothetical protein
MDEFEAALDLCNKYSPGMDGIKFDISMAFCMNGVSRQKSKTFFLHFLIENIILHNLSKI